MSKQSLSQDTLAKISRALQSKNKIEAVRIYREATGQSLRDAKNAVEALMSNGGEGLAKITSEERNVQDEILDAIFDNRTLDAVKLYHESTGKNLRESIAFIRDLKDQLKTEAPDQFQPESGGCLGILIVALGLTLWSALVA